MASNGDYDYAAERQFDPEDAGGVSDGSRQAPNAGHQVGLSKSTPTSYHHAEKKRMIVATIITVYAVIAVGSIVAGVFVGKKLWSTEDDSVAAVPSDELILTPSPTETTQEPISTQSPTESTEGPISPQSPTETTEGPISTQSPTETTEGPISTPTPTETTEGPISTQSPTPTEIMSTDPPTDSPTDSATWPVPNLDYSTVPFEDYCSSEGESFVYCDDGMCDRQEYKMCRVRCRPNSCSDSAFISSLVECLGSDSCNYETEFYAAATTCEGGSCSDAYFYACSCCDGGGCPTDIPSCLDDPIGFCSSTYLGISCKDWGNPVCAAFVEPVIGRQQEEPNPLQPLICRSYNECREASITSSGVFCTSNACKDTQMTDSIVECAGDSCQGIDGNLDMRFKKSDVTCSSASCQYAYFEDSNVECSDYPACHETRMVSSNVTCVDGGCNSAAVWRSTIACDGSGSCSYATILGSNVTCSGDGSCPNTEISKGRVDCQMPGSCTDTSFSTSVVFCDIGACPEGVSLKECSCCDGPGCPEVDDDRQEIRSCETDVDSFCSMTVDGKTCREWGNPTCQESADDDEATAFVPTPTEETCSTEVETGMGGFVLGSAQSHCPSVVCDTENTCEDATYYNSVVTCTGQESCYDIGFLSVDYSVFVASQVTCTDLEGDEYGACEDSRFAVCSCCTGDCDGNDAPSCTDEGFCTSSTMYLGRSCASWGNPACQGMAVPDPPEVSNGRICRSNDCRFTDGTSMGMFCQDDDCEGSHLDDSQIECTDDSCMFLRTVRSVVSCLGGSCDDSQFVASQVRCETQESCGKSGYGRVDARFLACTCCDGLGCPNEDDSNDGGVAVAVPTCTDDFCSGNSGYMGVSCKDWGNPFCNQDVDYNVLDESTKLSTFSRICDRSHCFNELFDGGGNDSGDDNDETVGSSKTTAVLCLDGSCVSSTFKKKVQVGCFDGACNRTAIENRSTVSCIGRYSCGSIHATGSTVICDGLSSCNPVSNFADRPSSFVASNVRCDGEVSCQHAHFGTCSCCDGDGCPSTMVDGTTPLPSCTSSSPDDFCSSTTLAPDGRTCNEWANPICVFDGVEV